MKRIYESNALHRDDEDAFSPVELEEARTGGGSINWAAASHALLPNAVRKRAIRVRVETNKETYAVGEDVLVRVTFRNTLPIPVSVRVPTQRRWNWGVDGLPEASHVPADAPADPALFRFRRARRRVFERTWSQRVQVDAATWEAAAPGEHEIAAWIATDDPEGDGLYASTMIRIEGRAES